MIPRYDFKQRVVKHKVTLKGKNVCGTHINMNGKGTVRASAMAQQLRPPAALAEDLDWLPGAYMGLTMICNSSFRDSDCFLLLASTGTKHTCGAHTYMQPDT